MRRDRQQFWEPLFARLETSLLPLKVKLLKLLSDPQDAIKNNSFYGPELKIEKGNLKKGFSEADNVVSGTAAQRSSGDGLARLRHEIQELCLESCIREVISSRF